MALVQIKHRPQAQGLVAWQPSARRPAPRREIRKRRAFCLHLRSGVRQENRQIVGDYTASINLRAFLTMQNYQGSVIAYINATGTLNDLYKYGPYGEPKNISNADSWTCSRFRYTGQTRLDSGELYYYKARVYDPKHGRFLQTDPIGSKDDLDLYAYTGGDPVNKSDPDGMEKNAWGETTPISEKTKQEQDDQAARVAKSEPVVRGQMAVIAIAPVVTGAAIAGGVIITEAVAGGAEVAGTARAGGQAVTRQAAARAESQAARAGSQGARRSASDSKPPDANKPPKDPLQGTKAETQQPSKEIDPSAPKKGGSLIDIVSDILENWPKWH